MKGVIVDYRTSKKILDKLSSLGFEIIMSDESKSVSPFLSGHPDMQICKCSGDVFVCAPECYEYYKMVLSQFNVKLLCGKTGLECNYPNDIAYNVVRIGNIAIHNFDFTDGVIKDCFVNLNVKMLNVKQGYAKCNVCVVGDNSAITSDVGIYKKLVANDVDTLLIDDGDINIWGWEHGFIGGASGMLDDKTLAFCGNVQLHPCGHQIENFCFKHNVSVVSLADDVLFDYGSIIPVGNA